MRRLVHLLLALLAASAAGLLRADEPPEIVALRAKAEKGNGLAQYNLGLAYAAGDGVKSDLPEAFVWLSLASENGATGKALDRVIGNITDAQLAEGRLRLADYRAALAAKAALSVRTGTRRTANRGFSLTALPSIDPGINPETEPLVTHPPGSTSSTTLPASSAASPAQSASIPQDNSELRAEVARLNAALAQASQQMREQALAIQKLQEQVARRDAAALSPSPLPGTRVTTPADGTGPRPAR